jgi:2-isopropylmalate synthase
MQHTSMNAEEMRRSLSVSPYNRIALKGALPKEVRILDTTLRDGEQAPGIALSSEDKVRIARALDELGVDCIEAGFAASGESELETLYKISELGLKADVCSLARASESDVDAVVDSGLSSVHIFIATSDLHLKYKLKMTREEVLERAVSSISYAKDRGLAIQFSCEDATRTDLDFLVEVMSAAEQAGADTVNIPDTVGVVVPGAMSYLVSEVAKKVHVPVSVHCHNDLGLAVANSIAAVEAGASMVHATVNGIGERTGNAALEEVAVNLFVQYGIETVDLSAIGRTSKLVERITGFPIQYNKPIVGRNAFAHESGIHVHGIIANASTYEPFPPEMVGVDRQIVIGKHSGLHSVRKRLDDLKIDLPEDLMPELTAAIKEIAIGDKEIDDNELRVIADQVMWKGRAEDRVVLEEFAVFTGKDITPTATVTVTVDGKRRTVSQTGVGPVSAAHAAIRKAVSESISLEEYKLNAVTGRSDSIAQVTVMIKDDRSGGREAVGRAVGPDIIKTSVDAMMEAINRDYAAGGKHRWD